MTTRTQYREELQSLERTALGALDLIVQQVERVTEALEQQDVELGTFVIADDDRVDDQVHGGGSFPWERRIRGADDEVADSGRPETSGRIR